MASEVTICNLALGWIGGNLITSLLDPSREAQLCNANYAELRDAVTEEGRWTFAKVYLVYGAITRLDAEALGYGWKYAFPIPNEILLTLRVFDRPDSERQTRWEKAGNLILTDDKTIYTESWRQVTNPNEFTATFRQALAARIARDLCLPLTQNKKLWDSMAALYESNLSEALAIDGMQGRNEKLDKGPLIRVRQASSHRGTMLSRNG